MKRRLLLFVVLAVGLIPLASATVAPATAANQQASPASAADRYIIVFKDDVIDPEGVAGQLARDRGFAVNQVYRYALKGFAARLPLAAVEALKRDPRIQSVEPDRQRTRSAQVIPTGVRRISTLQNTTAKINGVDQRVNVDVAVIDGLVQANHPDLNVVFQKDCTNDPTLGKPDLHGTHVAGTIAALDNGIGVVGVAPGARIWSYKVFDAFDFGFDSYIVCALDDIAHRGTIEVANMSLGGPGRDRACIANALHLAVCRAVNAGVTIAVAAGNECANAATEEPAAYDQVITVSALADSDGLRGGKGPNLQTSNCTRAVSVRDDRFAPFSNFGADVDIAGPGVNILSTIPGGYGRLSGTSMASPHVAGGAALYKATHPAATPAQVRNGLIATRERSAMPGDPDAKDEGVLYVGS